MEEQIQKFIDVVNEIDLGKLTDKQLKDYHDMCCRAFLDAMKEYYDRWLIKI